MTKYSLEGLGKSKRNSILLRLSLGSRGPRAFFGWDVPSKMALRANSTSFLVSDRKALWQS